MPGLNEVQISRWDDLLQRLAGIKQPGPLAPVVATEVLPVVVLEGDRPDHEYDSRTYLAAGAITAAATAGNKFFFALENPTGSGKLLTVESLELRCAAQELINGYIATYAASSGTGAIGASAPADTRWIQSGGATTYGVTGQTRASMANPVLPPILVYLPFRTVVAGGFQEFAVTPFVLSPGYSAILAANPAANNGNETFQCRWRERPLEPSEV